MKVKYQFLAQGHKNIRATHKATIEFTKDSHITEKGDCIVAVNSKFDIEELKKFPGRNRISIEIECSGVTERLTAIPSQSFESNNEIVVRKTEYISSRTFAINADKSAAELNRELIKKLSRGSPATITITEID